jgi:hypothetical protein
MSKGVSQCILTVSLLYFGSFNPFHYSPLAFYLPPPIFNSFQYTSLYPLPSQMLCFTIFLVLYHSCFFSLLPQVQKSGLQYCKHVLNMSLCMVMFNNYKMNFFLKDFWVLSPLLPSLVLTVKT